MRRFHAGAVCVTASLMLAACGGGETADDAAMDAAGDEVTPTTATVTIEAPAAGDSLEGPVRVVLSSEGVEIAPAAEARPGTAHHHLYVDTDLTPLDVTIPAGDASIIHLGGGETEYVLEGLAAGPHRVIALLADPAHVPLDPPAADTVEFVIR